jgi:hypothetical protein
MLIVTLDEDDLEKRARSSLQIRPEQQLLIMGTKLLGEKASARG